MNRKNWKNVAIELKFAHLLTKTFYEVWRVDEFRELSRKLRPYVRKLNIRDLKTLKDFALERNPSNVNYKIYNYSDAMFSHGDLSFLDEFKYLQDLTVSFNADNLQLKYHERYFESSIDDIVNLSRALSKLPKLRTLTLRGNKMNGEKLRILVQALYQSRIKKLDLSFCGIDSIAIQPLALFLCENENHVLEYLELRGNFISGAGIKSLASGLAFFKGVLKYLGLSRNPVEVDGADAIVDVICKSQNIEYIDLSSCELGPEGVNAILRLVKETTSLRKLDISSVAIPNETAFQLVKALLNNYKLEIIECRQCELSDERAEQIKTLLERNLYYVQHPYLLKSHFTEEDEREIDGLLANQKNSLLEKAKEKVEVYEAELNAMPFESFFSFAWQSQRRMTRACKWM